MTIWVFLVYNAFSMNTIVTFLNTLFIRVKDSSTRQWRRFRALRPRTQAILGAIALGVLVLLIVVLRADSTPDTLSQERTVTLATVGSLAGNQNGASIIGTVRSVSEASILAQSGGTVKSVNTSVGANVPAGFVIASLDNASESAQVLQAQGAYDAAIAARTITRLQSGNSVQSFSEAQTSARTEARSAYTTLDTTLTTQVDQFFGENTPVGPRLLINPGPTSDLPRKRADLDVRFDAWGAGLANAESRDPDALLTEAFTNADALRTFLNELARAANDSNSRATPDQFAALASARATVDGQLASISAARDAYRAKKTAAQVGSTQSQSTDTRVASADASVKQALGSLRAAQASYEKTVVRAPISGTVNFLPIRVGDYVTNLMHVATVAQNGALEIVAYVSEDDAASVAAGTHVAVEGGLDGIVTSVAPALDPVTRQIEIHIALTKNAEFLNGQTLRITLPSVVAAATPASSGPQLIPLTALKLTSSARVVFTVGEDGRLVAHPVEIGEVHGDRIELHTPLASDLRIVTNARGLSEGQKVTVGPDAS